MTIINDISRKLMFHGKSIYDSNLNRNVKELTCEILELNLVLINKICNEVNLNSKYQDELQDISNWYYTVVNCRQNNITRRQIVYFNNSNYVNRKQCISLFQILDSQMIVYQRSGDVEKMLDDFRFFIEIRKRFFKHIDSIKIIYGSVHIKIIE